MPTPTFYLSPTGRDAGLTSIALGLIRALDRIGLRVHFFKPIAQPSHGPQGGDRSVQFVQRATNLTPPAPIPLAHAEELISENESDELMQEIVPLYQAAAAEADVVIVEGLLPSTDKTYVARLNADIADALDAEVILVSALGHKGAKQLNEEIELAAQPFGGMKDFRLIGSIVNKINMPEHAYVNIMPEMRHSEPERASGELITNRSNQRQMLETEVEAFSGGHLKLIGAVPWQAKLIAPRTADIANFIGADILHAGDINGRRVNHIIICARTIPNMTRAFQPNVLLVTPGDRDDVLLAASMAALNGVPISGILFTSGIQPDERIMEMCQNAFNTGLPLMLTHRNTYETATSLNEYNLELSVDDGERLDWVMNNVARNVDSAWLRDHCNIDREPRLSPPAFRFLLTDRARRAAKRIILPEGDEPRTIRAAVACHERNIADCILLAEKSSILRVAEAQGVTIPDDMKILEPSEALREKYAPDMVKLRQHKGLTHPMAMAQLEDNVVLGTMMLALDEVDGLVSGAVHTTANTVRPALQLIKTAPDASLVSSVFFMLLPDQVLVYGDCAINPDPNAEELADIALQSADSAAAFGIPPRVAMISYSTGMSGAGSEVEKVRKATEIAKERRPDLLIDGPLQYDAAAIASVAAKKAPGSPVAGRATVFVFPDLNTGNTTYKAVQRSAHVVSVGPMLQGLNKPVNDLSRGALVDDIIYTIALTAIQAKQAATKRGGDD